METSPDGVGSGTRDLEPRHLKMQCFCHHTYDTFFDSVLCRGSEGYQLAFPDKITHVAISSCFSEKKD